jgi:hypothetical protein
MPDDDNLKVTVSIRIPLRLRARLTVAAYERNKCSINAEIVRRLEASFPAELEPHERQPAEQSHGP